VTSRAATGLMLEISAEPGSLGRPHQYLLDSAR
jgi:hypothetical protein